jgi:hypothetical protein
MGGELRARYRVEIRRGWRGPVSKGARGCKYDQIPAHGLERGWVENRLIGTGQHIFD